MKVDKVLQTAEYMSSEESFDDETEDEEQKGTTRHFLVRPLAWRTDFVNKYFRKLDDASLKHTRMRGGPASVERIPGLPSERDAPCDTLE